MGRVREGDAEEVAGVVWEAASWAAGPCVWDDADVWVGEEEEPEGSDVFPAECGGDVEACGGGGWEGEWDADAGKAEAAAVFCAFGPECVFCGDVVVEEEDVCVGLADEEGAERDACVVDAV